MTGLHAGAEILRLEPNPLRVRLAETGDLEEHQKALLANLRSEARSLRSLVEVLQEQKAGVSTDDLDAVSDSVHDAQRVLLTLKEARRQRRTLLTVMTGTPDVNLRDLEEALGPWMTADMAEAAEELHEAADVLSAQLRINGQLLRSALQAGEEFMRGVYGAGREKAVYSPEEGVTDTGRGTGFLINKQV